MNMRIVDLSVPLENDVAADPPGFGPAIQYLGHKDTISSLQMAFAGLKPEDLPDGEGWRSRRSSCRRTTARISMRPGTTPRPWTTASAPSPSTRCRLTGAIGPA